MLQDIKIKELSFNIQMNFFKSFLSPLALCIKQWENQGIFLTRVLQQIGAGWGKLTQ